MKFILHIICSLVLSGFALFVAAKYVPGIEVVSVQAAAAAVAALFVARYTIKPILSIVTLPINLVTLGLFSFVINGVIFYIVGYLVEGFNVTGVISAIVGSFVVSVIKTIGGKFLDTIF